MLTSKPIIPLDEFYSNPESQQEQPHYSWREVYRLNGVKSY